MTYHPRLGGVGLLLRPSRVKVLRADGPTAERGDILSMDFTNPYDPFLRLQEPFRESRATPHLGVGGLLLAEAFARLDLSRPNTVRHWTMAFGAVLVDWVYSPKGGEIYDDDGEYDPNWNVRQVSKAEILEEQRSVRRQLQQLHGLSASRPNGGSTVRYDVMGNKVSPALFARLWEGAIATSADLMRDRIDAALPGGMEVDRFSVPLVAREARSWMCVLAPIYLQLFEALRRISEGKPGAAECRECGQIFLILDGRRTTFCTQTEQNRWRQRSGRKRQAAKPVL